MGVRVSSVCMCVHMGEAECVSSTAAFYKSLLIELDSQLSWGISSLPSISPALGL